MASKILLIITGSIAAYKSVDLIRDLEKNGYTVSVILTQAAKNFITPAAISALTSASIYEDVYNVSNQHDAILHIKLAREHDIILVSPATANFMAKAAAGLAEGLALEALLAFEGCAIMAPAMNPQMWSNSVTQENIFKLKARNIEIIEPINGLVACGEKGMGKYAGNDTVLEYLVAREQGQSLSGKTAIVTLGSTQTQIDPVRYISNYSTGQQGLAIAEALHAHGCKVKLICGQISIDIPTHFDLVNVRTNEEMLAACLAALPADMFFACAAVCDYKVKNKSATKIKKQTNSQLQIELVEDVDVVATIAKLTTNRPKHVVGFALELQNSLANAQSKLQRKQLDVVVLNQVEQLTNQFKDFTVITAANIKNFKQFSKKKLAKELIDFVI